MRILISSVGTRGDVQPIVALALELRALGHELRLCLPPNFIDWVARLGFEARPIGIEMRAPRAAVGSARPLVIPDLITDQFNVVEAAAAGCELIVGGGAHQYAARSIAELCGLAIVQAVYAPIVLEEPKHSWNARALERVNANRTRLGLAPIDDVLGHILGDRPWLAADATLAPAPSLPGMNVLQTGAWVLPDRRTLAPELEAFLDAGEPPVYLGLGSMPAPAGTSRVLIEAVRAAGRRAILSRGWAELELVDDAPDCIAIDEVNQQALFPRVAAVVHHGGAGTTTAAARAGVAQVAVPMFGDQFYWSRRIRELGVGAALPLAELNGAQLTSALQEALDPAISGGAQAIARRISNDGAALAARRLTQE